MNTTFSSSKPGGAQRMRSVRRARQSKANSLIAGATPFGAVCGILQLACVIFALTLPHMAAEALLGGTGGMALAQVGTTVGTIRQDTTPDEHLVRDVSDVLTMHRPDRYALDTMLRMNGNSKPAKQEKIEWEEDDVIPRQDTVESGSSEGGSGSTQTITPVNPAIWRVNDLVILPTYNNRQLLVESKSGGQLTVRELTDTGFGTVPALSSGDPLLRASVSKTEFDEVSKSRATMPTQFFNRTQIFDGVLDVSGTRQATENYTTDDWERNLSKQMDDLRESIENANIWGQRSKTLDPEKSKQRTTQNGVTRYITENRINYNVEAGLTEGMLLDWAEQIFEGNSGSEERVFLMDSLLMLELAKINLVKMQTERSEEVLGVNVTRVDTPFGSMLFRLHRGFKQNGYHHWGLVLDLQHIRRRPLRRLHNVEEFDPKANGYDGDAEWWLEESSLEVRYDECHAIIDGTV